MTNTTRQDVTVRRGTPADGVALSALAIRTFIDTYAIYNSPADMDAYLAATYGVPHQTRELGDPEMVTLLADSPAGLVGFTQLRRKRVPPCITYPEPVEIYRFYVDTPSHGTGVAQQLMAAALQAARDIGGRHIWLGVWEHNPRGIAFYTKSGFRDVGSQVFTLGSDRQTDRVLVRSLSEE